LSPCPDFLIPLSAFPLLLFPLVVFLFIYPTWVFTRFGFFYVPVPVPGSRVSVIFLLFDLFPFGAVFPPRYSPKSEPLEPPPPRSSLAIFLFYIPQVPIPPSESSPPSLCATPPPLPRSVTHTIFRPSLICPKPLCRKRKCLQCLGDPFEEKTPQCFFFEDRFLSICAPLSDFRPPFQPCRFQPLAFFSLVFLSAKPIHSPPQTKERPPGISC